MSCYAASRLLVDGQLGPLAYDDYWFGDVVQRLTSSNVREVFEWCYHAATQEEGYGVFSS